MEIPVKAIRQYIEKALDIVIQVERFSDGRLVVSICEIVGFEGDNIDLREIFSYKQTGVLPNGEVIGEFVLNDFVPEVYKKIKASGIDTLRDIFE